MRISIKAVLNSEWKKIREELADMKKSINFINNQYEDFLQEHRANQTAVKDLKEHNIKLQVTIDTLNARVNELEQRSRSNNLELQCVPEKKNENLIEIVEKLGSAIGLDITTDKVMNITRVAKVNRQSTRPRSIIIQFNSPLARDSVLAAVIKHNKVTTVKHIKNFLQTYSWCRKFVPGFAKIAQPLPMLTRKDQASKWGEAQDQVFKELKRLPSSDPILIQPDYSRPSVENGCQLCTQF